MPAFVFHFSEDPAIDRFVPHVPHSNPTRSPAVWAIDEVHAPLYWFPRDCPRVAAWPRDTAAVDAFRAAFHTTSRRVHAAELGWLDRIRSARLFRYTFDASAFAPWPEASGQWVSSRTVEPVTVEPVGDLLDAHADGEIELRLVPSLWPVRDLAVAGPWDFSLVRMANARARS